MTINNLRRETETLTAPDYYILITKQKQKGIINQRPSTGNGQKVRFPLKLLGLRSFSSPIGIFCRRIGSNV